MRRETQFKMADNKAGYITKKVQKQASRAKEKILQNLGKADKTTDEIFDDYVHNFTKQQSGANRLHKEINNYVRCVRAMQAASKSLFDTVNEMYELEWTGRDVMVIQAQNLEMLWADFSQKLTEQVLIPLNNYMVQFPEVRQKIEKRGRKLLDYDSQRHGYEALLNNTKKRDEMKIAKAKDQLDDARKLYEVLNTELHEELPSLYDSRIPFLVSNSQTLCSAEALFHVECSKVHGELEAVMEKLNKEARSGGYNVKRHPPRSPRTPTSSPTRKSIGMVHGSPGSSPSKPEGNQQPYEEIPDNYKPNENGELSPGEEGHGGGSPGKFQVVKTASNPHGGPPTEVVYDIPVGATTDDLPPGVLYRVRATYRYQKEDVDELSFDIGEIIQVVEYEDPEDQEEGWLMGVKEATSEKGLFPANFTRPI